ncbi:uroporphyrinogen-III synthase [Ornithinibacillus xuwenensis]|uniref:Uroporphyrinogen-III synthase n=1 Tax=Ornithinibacillus xuwenensis TaxID=3144668 RepID=A0ABU9XCF0_9BACI
MELPLLKRKILITREAKQSKGFADKLTNLGAEVSTVPLLKINCKNSRDNQHMLQKIMNFQWIVFTSENGINCFFQLLEDDTLLQQIRFAVVGKKTEEALNRYGYQADLVPSIYDGNHLVTEFLDRYHEIGKVLLVQGNRSRDVIEKGLINAGVPYETLIVYETSYNEEARKSLDRVLRAVEFDFITFTSPSTVEAFHQFKPSELHLPIDTNIICIGKTTENRAKELGFNQTRIPDSYTIDGMIEVMCQTFNRED